MGIKALFIQYKSVFRFLILFLGTYIVLSLLYGAYLKFGNADASTDGITELVAKQTETILHGLGYDSMMEPIPGAPGMLIHMEGQVVGKIVEGCNATSIIILFISFIIAFSQNIKRTLLFIFGGAVLIYAINLVRIVVLAIALYKYPEHQELLHSVVFPGIIYGLVFMLWLLWIRTFTRTTNIE